MWGDHAQSPQGWRRHSAVTIATSVQGAPPPSHQNNDTAMGSVSARARKDRMGGS